VREAVATERDAITQVALDYFEGWFDGDIERMNRALHPDLVKRQAGDELGITTKERMLELTAAGDGAADGADPRPEVEALEVHGEIATAIVRSAVYREYLHLVRTTDGWRIANALWRFT
jgi:ketosteroid isomerase-like protein